MILRLLPISNKQNDYFGANREQTAFDAVSS